MIRQVSSNYFDEIVDTSSPACQEPEIEDSKASEIAEFESALELRCAERSDSESPGSLECLAWDYNEPWHSTASFDSPGDADVDIPDDADEIVSESTCETPSTCAGREDQSWLPIEGCWITWSACDSPSLRIACLGKERPPAQCRTGWDNDEAVDALGGRDPAALGASRVDEEDRLRGGDGLPSSPNDEAGAALTACTACPCSPVSLNDSCFPCLLWDPCAVE